jgi:hypothetical protein
LLLAFAFCFRMASHFLHKRQPRFVTHVFSSVNS